jgi:putative toxin-antitoxin system antitoxin component (TIGR02293 family)
MEVFRSTEWSTPALLQLGGMTMSESARKAIKQPPAPAGVPLKTFAMSSAELFEILGSGKKFAEHIGSRAEPLSEKNMVMLNRARSVWPRAVNVLGGESAARQWLVQTNRSLGGKCPLALLDNEDGYTLVLDTLGRIEYGIPS